MIGNAIPWTETIDVITEVTNGGDIIQPVLPGVVAIVLPQFGAAVYDDLSLSTGWAEYHPGGIDEANITYDQEGASVGPYQYVLCSGITPAARHGVITTAFYNVTAGHVLRLTVNLYGSNMANDLVARIEGYNATTTTVLAAYETAMPSTNVWTTFEVVTAPIPAGVTRVRVMFAGTFSTFGRHMKISNPIMWDDPNIATQPPLVPITWRDISCDVQSLAINYGRTALTDRFNVATLNLTLRNADGDYTYANPHPQQFGPGGLVRVTAVYEGITYPMAYGVIDSVTDDLDMDGKDVVNVTVYDPTSLWSSINWRLTYGVSAGSGELTGARINRLLDYVSYTARQVDAGTINVQPLPAVSGRPLRDDAGITADTEGGAVYAERNGSIVFRDATWRSASPYAQSVQANITAQRDDVPHTAVDYIPDADGAPVICPHEFVTDWSLKRLINRVALANAGGTAQTFDHLASQRKHGVRGYQRLDYIGTSDGYLAARAESLMAQYDQAKLRINAVSFRPAVSGTPEAWRFALQVFFNWLVRSWYRNPIDNWGFAVAAYVQGVEHRITATDWTVTLRLDDPAMFVPTTPGRFATWSIEDSERAIWDTSTWDDFQWDIPGERQISYWDIDVWS